MKKKQVPPPEGSVSKRREVVRARSTVVAIPPGKGNGREHQDLRRRHLLVREIVNDPRTSNIAALRPLEELSANQWRVSSIDPSAFSTVIPSGEAGAILAYAMHRVEASGCRQTRLLDANRARLMAVLIDGAA